jgi:hypothetical protein
MLPKNINWVWGLTLGLAAICAQQSSAQVTDEVFSRLLSQPDQDEQISTRHFRVGALVGFNFKADFSLNGTFKFSQNSPGTAGSGGVDRIYDDGFVKVDANGPAGGDTWNWGYQSSTQYSNSTQRLYFHAADTYTASGNADVTSDVEAGVELTYGGHLARWGRGLVGWEFGFGYLPINIEDNRSITGVSATRITHSFDASGITVPDAPYNGTYTGPGVLIGDQAQAEPGDSFTGRTLTGTRALDVTLYSFRLGPTLHWELHPQLAVAVSGGAAVGVLSGELKFNEAVAFPDGSTAVNIGSHSSTEITYGGYLSAALMYHAEKNGDLYLGVQYMPLSSATFVGAGREAKLNLSGAVFISAGINWPF